ncbi:hypothetical protein H2203_002717 [Taxawa tesnikishii (nom. ined.)]|nr:hypothetical protein H2203_002717 [Dothideales sp. JES 119]
MHGSLLLPALAGLAMAYPQAIDLDIIEAAPTPTALGAPIAAVSTAQTSVYDASAVVSTAAAVAVTAAAADATQPATVEKRQGSTDACSAQPAGYGPVTSNPDTAAAFLANPVYNQTALSAVAPFPYTASFVALQGATQQNTYMGYYTLQKYDPSACAAYCNQATGCLGFNIYFERDPSIQPADGCPNPASLTNIKCSLYGSAVVAASATNSGQWRDQFQQASASPSVANFTGPTALPAAIDFASLFITPQYYNIPFDVTVCAAACQAYTAKARSIAESQFQSTSAASSQHDGTYTACNYFNAYVVNKKGVPNGLYCSLYSAPVDSSYATNSVGNNNGAPVFSVTNSYAYTLTVQDDGNIAN